MTIEEIITRKLPCYFISPHLDDAVLSAGGLMSYLSGKTPITLINVFTKPGHKPYTMAAKGFLRDCGFTDAEELYKLRYEEDKQVCWKLGITSMNLGYIDGSFRRKTKSGRLLRYLAKHIPEVEHSYPLGRKLLRLAKDDQVMADEIKKRLLEITGREKEFVIFCPLGTVKHMDHVLTRDICLAIFKTIIFWNDYPYIIKNKKHVSVKNQALKQFSWDSCLDEKKELISLYKTQLPSVFQGGRITVSEETYSQLDTLSKLKRRNFFTIRPFTRVGKLAPFFK